MLAEEQPADLTWIRPTVHPHSGGRADRTQIRGWYGVELASLRPSAWEGGSCRALGCCCESQAFKRLIPAATTCEVDLSLSLHVPDL